MTLIRELIEIPERVHGGDFVLKLSEGVRDADATLRDYVVTPQLVRCFERAMELVRAGVKDRQSKGSYLHGSFGAGKSHFMAVLDLLLAGNAKARSIPELSGVVVHNSGWIEGKKFLLVPYHLIGAISMESAILGHYAEYVKQVRPEAPTPGVFAAEKIFADAREMRDAMGDEAFFKQINRRRGDNGDGDWGDLDTGWNADSFEHALMAAVGSEERARLVGDLVENFFTAYRGAGEFVSLDEGLSIMSRHAKELGYDAVVLFLDELVLWLASHAADPAFINREGQKVAKLVEAQSADRPIPIVSFIARQRDVRELIGENAPGAQQVAFGEILSWWEARFETIPLEDRNLPAIAEKRVLKPRNDGAKVEMDRAFEELRKRKDVFDTLLTTHADPGMFRQVYPFSPALVDALVAVSSMLQRERTALKVMVQLLVTHREHLKLGDIVPVGDLWDAIAEGDEPFNEEMRQYFDSAKRLYRNKLLPIIETDNGIRAAEVQKLAWDDPKAAAFRTDDRIIKTLLLSAMTPNVECFRDLTPSKLAALNHGSIKSPIKGNEGSTVRSKLQKWAAQAGEIRIAGDGPNPTVTLQLTGIDTQSIIDRAKVEDNPGNRLRKLRELILGALGVADQDRQFSEHQFKWRGTTRTCDVSCASIVEMQNGSFNARDGAWKVLIDVPIPPAREQESNPADAEAQLDAYQPPGGSTNTIAWIPAYFTAHARHELGQLVIIDRLLAGNRLESYAGNLSATDRAQARILLENQHSQLTERVKAMFLGAYGVTPDPAGMVDGASFEQSRRVHPLCTGLRLRPPVGATLGDAFLNLLDQALRFQFPDHPDFKAELTRGNLRKVYQELQRASQSSETKPRIAIDRPLRPLMRDIAHELRLGEMGEDHFVLDIDFWGSHFKRKAAAENVSLTVGRLRKWMDEPTPRGLPADAQNLIILTFADRENYSFFLHGGIADVTLESLRDDLELRSINLPSTADWEKARERAQRIFGLTPSQGLRAANVDRLVGEVRKLVDDYRAACNQYLKYLRERIAKFDEWGIKPPDSPPRLATATAVVALVEAIASAREGGVIEALTNAEIKTSAEAMASSLRKAKDLEEAMSPDATRWELFSGLRRITDSRAEAAQKILDEVAQALAADEYAVGLKGVLADREHAAIALVTAPAKREEKETPPPDDSRQVERGNRRGLDLASSRREFKEIENRLDKDKSLRLDLTWTLRKESDKK